MLYTHHFLDGTEVKLNISKAPNGFIVRSLSPRDRLLVDPEDEDEFEIALMQEIADSFGYILEGDASTVWLVPFDALSSISQPGSVPLQDTSLLTEEEKDLVFYELKDALTWEGDSALDELLQTGTIYIHSDVLL